MHRTGPHGADELGPDQLDLLPEVALAGRDLVRLRVAVARGAAFQGVRYVDVLSGQADPREQLLEQLAGLADERDALLVLVKAGSLADEHQVCARIARAEDDLRAPLRKPATGAPRDGIGEDGELVHRRDLRAAAGRA